MWNEMKTYRGSASEMEDDFSEDALDRAYRRGCEAGYRKAMSARSRQGESYDGYGGEDDGEDADYGGERRAWRIAEEEPRRGRHAGGASRHAGGGWRW